jgi:pilus assembly protein Flp/PilA
MIARQHRSDEGASAVEYALIVGAIAAVVIFVVIALGNVVSTSYTDSCTKIGSAMSSDVSKCK